MPQTGLTPADTDFTMKLKQVDYSNSEIGRKLGMTEGAIRYRLKRQASGEPDGRKIKPSELDAYNLTPPDCWIYHLATFIGAFLFRTFM